ncbi:Uncharacterised protein [Mycobacteroides abscessus subsp. abscessus]|uniref:hypothetical protein n=1 Tax=Mycobacteroides abscessus TaxID=36809 RepID=UPI000928FAA8|nr:hypothetical protein [Mycobacteroides abscessus]SHX10836.1 Uncharacterised protein [Mycobacteroides abscessus subsp. abscessus]SHX59352.1 Uncharacterised protein [Mycobacteroides abscessus subsp. abscessus]SIC05556.1 Uncharacterised protein [Mycobacteroides abscessus subsp. abscessus]SKV96642.1 Uncharacterised protein [Mycobacteroides abscessus subsp. abscessus]
MITPAADGGDETPDVSKLVAPELAENLRNLSVTLNRQTNALFKGIDLMREQWAEFYGKTTAIKISDGYLEGLRLREKQLADSFRAAFRGLIPANWPEGAISRIDEIAAILEADGIPIVHIPRAEIVAQLMDASTLAERLNIVEMRADDIANDCKAALSGQLHRAIEEQAPLAFNSVESFLDGHYAAAQALAVLVCDTYLKLYLGGEVLTSKGKARRVTYSEMAAAVTIENSISNPIGLALNIFYAFAPVASFLTEWWPDKLDQGPSPTMLSRHASVHNASIEFMTKRNATIAIMLVTSLTVAIDKMERWADRRKLSTS